MNNGNRDDLPLSGLNVVEQSIYVAAPMCGRMLADLGANVIKVESPEGDTWRIFGDKERLPCTDDENPCFDIVNSNKRGIVLDLKKPAAKKVMRDLLGQADVFISNVRIASLRRLGFDYDSIKGDFPKLIYGTVTGYGETGPDADKPGFDVNAFWGSSGYAADMRYRENSLPNAMPAGMGDSIIASFLLNAIMAALLQRYKTGRGDYLSLSLFNTALWVMNMNFLIAQDRFSEGPYRYPVPWEKSPVFSTTYLCSDGKYLQITSDYDKYSKAYFEKLGISHLLDDPKYSSLEACLKNSTELIHIIQDRIKLKSSAEWLSEFQKLDIPCNLLTSFRDVEYNEQAWANDMIERFQTPNGKQCIFPCNPIRMCSQEVFRSTPGPMLGEHTEDILKEMGYSDSAIAELLSSGAAVQYQGR